METIIRFTESQLSENGLYLLNTIRGQSSHYALILSPNQAGIIVATLAEAEDSSDVITVRVDDSLTWADRARKFGVSGLERNSWSGKVGNTGDPIPTEEYIQKVQESYGDDEGELPHLRYWEVPHAIVCQVRDGKLSGPEAWEKIAADFVQWCAAGDFLPWRNPDWITQTEAAELVGVKRETISNAVRDHRLATWSDPLENHPQRATRVSAQQVKSIWGN